jgi:SAM-dependent methyltransferase
LRRNIYPVRPNDLIPSPKQGLPSNAHADSAGSPHAPISRDCLACGRLVEHRFRFDVNGCNVFQCRSCGLGSADASEFDPVSYYTADYFRGGHADGYADYPGAEPVLRHEFARSVAFIRGHRSSGSLLELGCAYGFFLMEAARYYDVTGIELAKEAVEHARTAGLNVMHGVADEASLARTGPFDAIMLFDVIEHLPKPRDTLALCARHLKPRGIIVITTGDFGSPLARIMGRHWRLMTPPQHLWFFTRQTMRRLSDGLGLTVEHIDSPWKIVPFSLVLFQAQRMMGLRGRPLVAGSRIGLPVNLFDTMRVVLRKL